MPWTVYLLRCRDGSLYTGIARDLARRVGQHNAGRGAKYTRGRGPVRVMWTEMKRTQGAALRREAEIKRWPRARKVELARGKQTPGSQLSTSGEPPNVKR